MKSIKANQIFAKRPNKGKIAYKLYCILLASLRKKTDMKFINLASNLKENKLQTNCIAYYRYFVYFPFDV
jgi:hypothetical protein